MTTASITITVDQSLSFNHEFKGNPALLTAMLGAMDFSMEWMRSQIRKSQEMQESELCDIAKKDTIEIEVSRDVALSHYWMALDKLRSRLIAINSSSSSATFEIDPNLLNTL